MADPPAELVTWLAERIDGAQTAITGEGWMRQIATELLAGCEITQEWELVGHTGMVIGYCDEAEAREHFKEWQEHDRGKLVRRWVIATPPMEVTGDDR